MADEDKYYFKRRAELFSKREPPSLIKWNVYFSLEVDEEVEWRQRICFSAFKLGQKDTPPKGDKYTKLTAVLKETFLDHYNLAVKYIYETKMDDGEFYLLKHSKDWYEVLYYSKDEKNKQCIHIDFRDDLEDFWITVYNDHWHKYRPKFRKEATAITNERFKQFLNLTVQFLYDPDSMFTLLNDYIKNFKLLGGGDSKIEGLIIGVSKSFEEIFKQLESRKEHLEKRLIENDTDSNIDRAKLRGELEGINYAVKVINMNK